MSSFDLRRLRYFVAVAELGSVTRAASELHVAQPALSYQIRLLEEEVGGELFARGPRGVRLTELGIALAAESRRLLGDIKALRNRLSDRAGDPEGEVVVGLAQPSARCWRCRCSGLRQNNCRACASRSANS